MFLRLVSGVAVALTLAVSPPDVAAQHEEHDHGRHGDGGHGRTADHGHDHDATVRHGFDDVERWERVFDDPERDEWQKPAEVVLFLNLDEGDVVADLGAGTGYFMPYLAPAVGDNGKLLAIDVEPALVEHLAKRAAAQGATNVDAVLADPDDPKLPASGVDVVLIVDTWHHIDSRLDYLAKLARALKPGGAVVIVDFHEGELPVGPPPGHKLPRESVVAEFEEAGWMLDREGEALPYQYLLAFTPGAGPVE
jgi:ubiquinone/menaquinone biosynthesis C-methylase UbiE